MCAQFCVKVSHFTKKCLLFVFNGVLWTGPSFVCGHVGFLLRVLCKSSHFLTHQIVFFSLSILVDASWICMTSCGTLPQGFVKNDQKTHGPGPARGRNLPMGLDNTF